MRVAEMTAAVTPSDSITADLKPQKLWQYFAELSAIPRPSKHEQQ